MRSTMGVMCLEELRADCMQFLIGCAIDCHAVCGGGLELLAAQLGGPVSLPAQPCLYHLISPYTPSHLAEPSSSL